MKKKHALDLFSSIHPINRRLPSGLFDYFPMDICHPLPCFVQRSIVCRRHLGDEWLGPVRPTCCASLSIVVEGLLVARIRRRRLFRGGKKILCYYGVSCKKKRRKIGADPENLQLKVSVVRFYFS